MHDNPIIFTIFLIFTGAAILATLALYTRQTILLSYILLGVLVGPWGLGLVSDPALVQEIAHIGIIFLLFLLGLNLHPQELLGMFQKTTLVTLVSSLVFMLVGVVISWMFGYSLTECLLIGAAMIFSSTIIGVKLLPTTVLHHQHTGEVIISILLLQDLLAIVMLLVLKGIGRGEMPVTDLLLLIFALPGLILFSWLFYKFILIRLISKFDQIHEYIFLMAIGWCMGIAELAEYMGLTAEIGAFIAGITLAASPIAIYIADSLRPLRDFFLVLFFFSLGAGFNLEMIGGIALPAMLSAAAILAIKPCVFKWLLNRTGESPSFSREVGYRLGQMSEFSLLIAVLAVDQRIISDMASYLIQLTTLLTLAASSYLVVRQYPTPIAFSDKLRRD